MTKMHAVPRRLPADLMKLRDRYVATYPADAEAADRLTAVPQAFRHLLSLKLDLQRTGVTDHYLQPAAGDGTPGDPVARLVQRYAAALRRPGTAAAALIPSLRRYFTQTQLTELTLTLVLDGALDLFDTLIQALDAPIEG